MRVFICIFTKLRLIIYNEKVKKYLNFHECWYQNSDSIRVIMLIKINRVKKNYEENR